MSPHINLYRIYGHTRFDVPASLYIYECCNIQWNISWRLVSKLDPLLFSRGMTVTPLNALSLSLAREAESCVLSGTDA